MILNGRQFKEHIRQKAAAVVDKHTNRFLDFMDSRGADISQGINEQLATIEKYSKG